MLYGSPSTWFPPEGLVEHICARTDILIDSSPQQSPELRAYRKRAAPSAKLPGRSTASPEPGAQPRAQRPAQSAPREPRIESSEPARSQRPAPSAQRPAPSVKRPAPSAQRPAPSAQRPAPSAQRPAPSAQRPAPSAQCLAPSAQCPASSAQRPAARAERPAPAPSAQSGAQCPVS